MSEAYYQLQQDEQLVRVYDANLRNDLVILQDTFDLKRAGLVPRLDMLRRRVIQASDEETLIHSTKFAGLEGNCHPLQLGLLTCLLAELNRLFRIYDYSRQIHAN